MRFSLFLGLMAVFAFGLLFFKIYSIKAQEQIKILPGYYSGSWQNQENINSQDLYPESGLLDFNAENSAYINFILEEEAEEEIKEEGEEEEGEVIVAKISGSLILSDFSTTEDLKEAEIQSVKLFLSLAAKGGVDDKIIIDYFQEDWINLDEFNLENEISNNLNSGYFIYDLSGLNAMEDLNNLKVRIGYAGQEGSLEAYLDSVWLEIDFSRKESVVETIKSILILKLDQQEASLNIFKSQDKYYLDELNDDLSGAIVNEIKISWVAEYSYRGEKFTIYEKELDWVWKKTENGLLGTTKRYTCPIDLEYSFQENNLNVKTSVVNEENYPVENLIYRFIVKYSPDFSLDNSEFTLNKGEERVQFNIGSDVLSKSLERISDGEAEILLSAGTVNPGDKSEISINLF